MNEMRPTKLTSTGGLGDDAQDRLEALPAACALESNRFSLRKTDPAVAADMGPHPARSPPERDATQIRQ